MCTLNVLLFLYRFWHTGQSKDTFDSKWCSMMCRFMLLLSLRKQLQARHKKPPEDCTTLDAIMLSTVSAEKDTDSYRYSPSIRVLT